jgi:hypothetical protein
MNLAPKTRPRTSRGERSDSAVRSSAGDQVRDRQPEPHNGDGDESRRMSHVRSGEGEEVRLDRGAKLWA